MGGFLPENEGAEKTIIAEVWQKHAGLWYGGALDYQFLALTVPPEQVEKEKRKARELRQSQWWKQKLAQGLCHYCEKRFEASELTMDHVVPLARGGRSTKGNVVLACKPCNNAKKWKTPAEILLETLKSP